MQEETRTLDLALVMPIYNEEECIVDVVNSWLDVLNALEVDYRAILLNDGSTDETAKAVDTFAGNNRVEIVHKPNSGHGPTILMGYRRAVQIASWVFQTDSDGEMKAEYFPNLWRVREDYDALFGTREGRDQGLARKVISAVSRLTVRVLFGTGVKDVNTAYRLIRAGVLERIIKQIPDDTVAPNVIISGAMAKAGLRFFHYPIPFEFRKTGTVSIIRWKLCKLAIRAFFQTLSCRPSM